MDLNNGMEWLFEDHGKAIKWTKGDLSPRDDVIEFDTETGVAELEKNLDMEGCPEELQPHII